MPLVISGDGTGGKSSVESDGRGGWGSHTRE